MSPFRPVTGGADQDEEEDVDSEGVKDSYDGAFRNGNAGSLQLPLRDRWQRENMSVFVYTHTRILLNVFL